MYVMCTNGYTFRQLVAIVNRNNCEATQASIKFLLNVITCNKVMKL